MCINVTILPIEPFEYAKSILVKGRFLLIDLLYLTSQFGAGESVVQAKFVGLRGNRTWDPQFHAQDAF